ncbi:UDP-glucose--galactose-1-phosphate uridylyltransferase [Syntrophotalea carbinolica DSM 2380]|uniref:UDP-glucose--galactose-1-phosphate uridylyltransferase n=1 Tax=Syntrophotalea carbinolica (strain DSM 2380 / NBRC 103641 / GraBd1) TaxID=338963 RepID=Q3A0B6_SYNC1|nr:galactose-1-phosphate uridylyltransferase [Syntrophotalea carbinolica]ABA90191.1 UDP-glucose--galactose-1-phosphate uridylyltransferase [Syntrophotalea carbinolica DSM 2380]
MSELRWDPFIDSWVAIVKERGRRPVDFITGRKRIETTVCPFCYGHENKTPAEVYALRPDGSPADQPGWRVRVIPNKFPILRIEGQIESRGEGLYDVKNGIGAHEVIIETPDHDRHPADLRATELADVFHAFRSRLIDLRRDKRFRHIVIYKNHGVEAGATIPHTHSLLLALPIIPPHLCTALRASREHFRRKERCLMCDLLAGELADGRRLVRVDTDFAVFTPFASRYPFSLRIVPRHHQHDFSMLTDQMMVALGETVRDVLGRLRSVLRDPPFNLVLHNAPSTLPQPGKPDFWSSLSCDYHWYFEIIPKIMEPAGFEWGTGFFINPTSPEEAARYLREAAV